MIDEGILVVREFETKSVPLLAILKEMVIVGAAPGRMLFNTLDLQWRFWLTDRILRRADAQCRNCTKECEWVGGLRDLIQDLVDHIERSISTMNQVWFGRLLNRPMYFWVNRFDHYLENTAWLADWELRQLAIEASAKIESKVR